MSLVPPATLTPSDPGGLLSFSNSPADPGELEAGAGAASPADPGPLQLGGGAASPADPGNLIDAASANPADAGDLVGGAGFTPANPGNIQPILSQPVTWEQLTRWEALG